MKMTDNQQRLRDIQMFNAGATEERRELRAYLKRAIKENTTTAEEHAYLRCLEFVDGRIKRSRKAKGGLIGLKRNSKENR
jgi:hypothetical protein